MEGKKIIKALLALTVVLQRKNKTKIFSMIGTKSHYLKKEMQEVNIIVDLDILRKRITNFHAVVVFK